MDHIMKKNKIYIIEDNISYRMDLKRQLEQYFISRNAFVFNYEIILINNYNKFYEEVNELTIKDGDIFIVDIDLKTYFSGIDLSKNIRNSNQKCKIIFLTSNASKAIEVINRNINSSAYLIKTNDLEILQLQINDLFQSLMSELSDKESMLIVHSNYKDVVLRYSDILFISTMSGFRNQVLVQTSDSKMIVQTTLSKLKLELPSPPFYIDFKSIIINCNNIESLSSIHQLVSFKNHIELLLSSKLINKLIKFQKGLS